MRSKSFLVASFTSVLVLGSVVALAQTAPLEPVSEGVVVPSSPPESGQPEPMPALPVTRLDPALIEDEPVEVPANTQSDWAPDINLDAQREADSIQVTPQRKAPPRKILSDAGENRPETDNWPQSPNGAAAQAQLLSREGRRERAVDPAKRAKLSKLSRVMGALHALRVSCAGRDDQTYRSRMATMLDLEAPSNGALRDPLVDAFNAGFQAYGRGVSGCPADARVQEASLAKEGYGVARQMAAQYRPAPKPVAALPPANQPRKNAMPVVKTAIATPPPAAGSNGSTTPARPSWTGPTAN